MGLFTAILRPRQDELHTQRAINELLLDGYESELARTSKSLPALAYQPAENVAAASRRASTPKPKYRALSSPKLVQLNARVSEKRRDAMRAEAARRGMSLAAAVDAALALWLRRGRQ